MKSVFCVFSVLIVVAAANTGASCQQTLQCSVSSARPASDEDEEFVQPRTQQEADRAKQSPHGARRLGKHTLEVGWSNGKRIFKDKPPYNEPLDGLKWTYCGYNSTLKLHMLIKSDDALFTGVLVDDATGALLPGGEKVLFSKDAQYYLAYEQPDGQDGETIKLYSRNGHLLWKGYNGFIAEDGKSVVAEFTDAHWDSQGRLQAVAKLDSGKQQTVTLTRLNSGKWDWLPHISQ